MLRTTPSSGNLITNLHKNQNKVPVEKGENRVGLVSLDGIVRRVKVHFFDYTSHSEQQKRKPLFLAKCLLEQ